MEQGFFLVFAIGAVAAALGMVLARNPIHSAVALMACFVNVSAIFVMLEAPLLAVIQIFVYVGAILVLFLFVTMMLDIRDATLQRSLPGSNFAAFGLVALLGIEMLVLVLMGKQFPETVAGTTTGGEIRELGTTLFADYLLPFEVASVILLVALVGAIVLAQKEPR